MNVETIALEARGPESVRAARLRLILVISAGVSASVMSTSILTLLFPDLTRSFGISFGLLQWRNILFYAVFATAMLVFGRTVERFGARRQFLAGLGLFAAAAGMSWAAASLRLWWPFVTAQTLQALADGMIVPAQIVLIRNHFRQNELGWAFGWFGGTLSASTLAAPALGGVLLETFGWQSPLALLLFVGLAVLAVASRAVPADRVSASREGQSPVKLPWLSIISVLGLVICVNGLLEGGSPPLPERIGIGAVLVGLLAALGWSERAGKSREPLLPLRMLEDRHFALSCGRAFLVFLATNALSLFGPTYLRLGLRLTGAETAALMMTSSLITALLSPWTGRIADRVPYGCMVVGYGISASACLLYAGIPADVGGLTLPGAACVYALLGIGSALAFPANQKITLSAVAKSNTGLAMGFYQFIQFVSGSFAAAGIARLISSDSELARVSVVLYPCIALYALALATVALQRRAA